MFKFGYAHVNKVAKFNANHAAVPHNKQAHNTYIYIRNTQGVH